MAFSNVDLGHLLLAVGLLLCFAHGLGYTFRKLRQPPVIGEILGGLLLGPTVLGAFFPDWQRAIFAANQPSATVLGAIYQLGLLLLMFSSGAEMKTTFRAEERRTAIAITIAGTVFPLAAGFLLSKAFDPGPLIGPAGNMTAYVLVFGIAIAVTSIPVISRILADLGILETPFARIVLSAAVVEDVLLYVALSVALGAVGRDQGGPGGLGEMLGIEGSGWQGLAYHIVASIVFFGLALTAGPALFRGTTRFRLNVLVKSSAIANTLIFMLAATGVAILLGVAPMLGAFVAGLAAGRATSPRQVEAREVIRSFASASLVPVYFAIVGLRLNLRNDFNPVFFVEFLAAACVLKAVSVFIGARLARESNAGALNLAVSMNARGGPGIVLASVALDAGIVSSHFYSSLVMLAIVTSLIAGSWLDVVVRKKWALR